jgi:hypothetical protein
MKFPQPNGMMLTGPEAALAKFWAGKFEDKQKKENEIKAERELLAKSNFLAMAKVRSEVSSK